jgi:hypothetical protein
MENELVLSVNKIELGTLTTNAIAIRDTVKDLLKNYKADNYDENNIDKAKEDKAMLNTTSKKLNDKRIELEKEFMTPFNEFKDVISETTTMIKEASSQIDLIVKEVENKAKETRRNTIETYFKALVGELDSVVTLDIIFDEKWLNKGSFNDKGEFKLLNELENKLNDIRKGLEAIKNLNSKHELALKSQYLKNFDLGQAIAENNRLNELEQKSAIIEEKKEEIKEAKIEEMLNTPVEEKTIDVEKTYTLEITGTTAKLEKLKEFMNLNNIRFKKI